MEERYIGRYRLVRVAGRGATSTVYEAVDERFGRTVALKALAPMPHLSTEEYRSIVRRMQREARAVAKLMHPNVALVLDMGEEGDTPENEVHYLVLEFLRGETLRERLDRVGHLSPDEAAAILDQSAAGLDAVHAAGVIHRDVKPSNLMILPDDTVKLMDFGVARQAEDATVTRTGMMIGSPAYMAPEQIRGEPASPASDIWSLGVVLYEMLAGRGPFTGENVPATLYQVAHGGAPALIPGLPVPLQEVVSRALERDPAHRFAHATDLARAFRAALEMRPLAEPMRRTAVAAVAPRRPAPARRDPSYAPALGITGAIVGVIALASFVTLRHRSPEPHPSASRQVVAQAPATRRSVSPTATARASSALKPRPTPTPKPTPTPHPSPSAVRIVEVTPRPEPTPVHSPTPTPMPQQVALRPTPRPTPRPATPVPPPHPTATPTPFVASPAIVDKDEIAVAPRRAQDAQTLSGLWKGTFSGHPALLVINMADQSGLFDGNLTVRVNGRSLLIAITGRLSDDGTLSLTERRIVSGSARDWDLGTDIGSVDPTTGALEGTGKDSKGRRYHWTFRR